MFEAKRDPSNVRNFLRISYKTIDRKFKIKAWPLKKKKENSKYRHEEINENLHSEGNRSMRWKSWSSFADFSTFRTDTSVEDNRVKVDDGIGAVSNAHGLSVGRVVDLAHL